MNWRHDFAKALALCVEKRTQLTLQTPIQVFQTTRRLTDAQRRGIWVSVASQLNITQKQAHDYFHNTYAKQFHESIAEYKPELVEMLTSGLAQCTATSVNQRQIINCVIHQFQKQHVNKNFHVQTIYSFLYHQFKTLAEQRARMQFSQHALEVQYLQLNQTANLPGDALAQQRAAIQAAERKIQEEEETRIIAQIAEVLCQPMQ